MWNKLFKLLSNLVPQIAFPVCMFHIRASVLISGGIERMTATNIPDEGRLPGREAVEWPRRYDSAGSGHIRAAIS